MTQPGILLVESDVLVRHPLAEYLRECGYQVREASNSDEARKILDDDRISIDIVLADIDAPVENGFELAAWIRRNHSAVQVILAGSVVTATEKAGDLCHDGPTLTKPYEHHFVLEQIRRLRAARDRNQ
jgi:DNA-binding response OmpR family regulator